MKTTPDDLTNFKGMSQTELGKWLVDYAKRVEDAAYDSRNWEPGMTIEAAKLSAKLIREHFINRIRPKVKEDEGESEYE